MSWWVLLEQCESSALEDAWGRAFMKQLAFPFSTFEREVLLMSSKTDFGELTDEIRRLVAGFAGSWLFTNVNKDCMILYMGAQLSSVRWRVLPREPLARGERRPLSQGVRQGADQHHCRSLASGRPPQKVDTDHNPDNFSLGAPALCTLKSEGDFPHISPQSLKLRGPAWRALRTLKGDWQLMRKTWLSLLFLLGFLAQGRIDGRVRGGSLFQHMLPVGRRLSL